MSLNLHGIVRGAICANYADEQLTLYRSMGQTPDDRGVVKAYYAPAVVVMGNFQSEGDATLDHADLAGKNTTVRKLYLYAPADLVKRPWALYRPLSRSGDYVADSKGKFWLVTAVTEDFSDAGWVCLRVTLQTKTPELNIYDDSEETDGDE